MLRPRSALILLIAALAGWTVLPVLPLGAEPRVRYFPETGHNVQGVFLDYFDAHGGLDVLGYPITEQFYDERPLMVQFFQRAVMEYRPSNRLPYRVQLALLGDLLGYAEPRTAPPRLTLAGARQTRHFRETGHSVSYPFLSFFNRYGGVFVFGYPISEAKIENGRTVQYFQRARLEWYPKNRARYQVQLGLLGVEYAERIGLKPSLLARTPPLTAEAPPAAQQPTPSPAPALTPTPASPVPDCTASVRHRVMGLTGTQVVTAQIADQATRRGLPDVEVTMTARLPEGNQYLRGRSDSTGAATFAFDIGTQQAGLIIVVDIGFSQNGRVLCGPIRTYFIAWSS